MMTSGSTANAAQEYSIRVPKNVKKNYKVMRFNSSVNVDFTKWSQVKMERENNMKEYKGMEDEMPKFGAGSEFGRDAREEARRRKYGINIKKYRPEDQPWIMKIGGKTGKKFKGTREGGVSENAAYYVFTHARDGAIEAFPIQEWYNFQPTQRYKSLSAEEAELEFGRRNKQVNYFSLMMRKRLRGDDEIDPEDPEEAKTKGKMKKKDLKISEMDDWVDSEDDEDSEENEGSNDEKEKEEKDKKKKKDPKAKKKKKDPLDEAFEESDDGDEEGREVDYISDSSDSDSDHETKVTKQLQGVAEEDALRKLLSSGEEDEEEEEKEENKDSEGEDKPKTDGASPSKEQREKKLHKKKKNDPTKKNKPDGNGSSSEFSSDSSDSDGEPKKKSNSKKNTEPNSNNSSRSGTPTKDIIASSPDGKRKASAILESSLLKKNKLDNFSSAPLTNCNFGSSEAGITEDAVRRYLMRKPMTTTELLQKFKSKKTGLTSDQLVNIMTQILKRINPVKQTIKGKMYLSLKA